MAAWECKNIIAKHFQIEISCWNLLGRSQSMNIDWNWHISWKGKKVVDGKVASKKFPSPNGRKKIISTENKFGNSQETFQPDFLDRVSVPKRRQSEPNETMHYFHVSSLCHSIKGFSSEELFYGLVSNGESFAPACFCNSALFFFVWELSEIMQSESFLTIACWVHCALVHSKDDHHVPLFSARFSKEIATQIWNHICWWYFLGLASSPTKEIVAQKRDKLWNFCSIIQRFWDEKKFTSMAR